MNKPKSTTIELTESMLASVDYVSQRHLGRDAVPGRYKVYRKDGKIFLEVFSHDA